MHIVNPTFRVWDCPCCQAVHVRDENAAINGFNKILRDLQTKCGKIIPQVPCSGLFQVVERWAWRVLPSGVQKALRGLNRDLSQRQEMKLKT